ncbi:unnamed protein product [Cercospora beticola]|nr:unnamed protein product [Cercospora beticola]
MLINRLLHLAILSAGVAEGQRTTTTRTTTVRTTSTSTTLTASNTRYGCGCVSPTNSLRSTSRSGITTITTTLQPSATFACNCRSTGLVSTTRSSTTRTSSTRTSSTRSATTSSSSSVIASSSSSATSSGPSLTPSQNATVGGQTVKNTILVLARNSIDAELAYSGFQGYGIPYEVLLVPQSGVSLPTLNSSATEGNYGGFIIVSELSYQNSAGNWVSGLTDAQFTAIYNYQKAFGVRMTRLDTYPWSAFGAVSLGTSGGCCDYNVEQQISFTNTSGFSTANVKTDAGMSTKAIWHYPAQITDPKTTWEIASFGPSSDGKFSSKSTAAVINDFDGRQQMVFFTGWASEWSATSTYLQHAYIHWMTRGLFVGARKIYLAGQIDDVHLRTQTYSPLNNYYRSDPQDYRMHAEWQDDLNSRLPAGSNFFLELGHNGNGDIIAATNGTNNGAVCKPNTAIYYIPNDSTALEYQKPLGTGKSVWPTTPTNYTWTVACASKDALAEWFMDPINRDHFAHVSHTFTHLHQNNATYDDIYKEILFNKVWMEQLGISKAKNYSPGGLIPPAITGLHNGDAMRAWADNGIISAVGDNSRPVLRNTKSDMLPLISTTANNGFDGMVILPRWPTKIYYDCDTPDCTTKEWTDLFGGTGSFTDLMESEKSITTRYLMGLHHDLYMFHQANMRVHDLPVATVGSQTRQMSLVQIWIETVTQEMARLTNWPIVTLKHDDIAQRFLQRMAREQCEPNLVYRYNQDGSRITGVTVSAKGSSCSAPIPVTFPGAASGGSATDDKLGSEPLIKWVTLSGSTQTYTLATPVPVRA